MKWLLFLSLLLAAGCVRVDYVGKTFAPTGNTVKVYQNEKELPQDTYTIVGRFTVTAKPDVHIYDVEDKVFRRAAEYGGDAICLVKTTERAHAVYNTELEEFGASLPTKKTPQAEEKLFGKRKNLETRHPEMKRKIYCYLLLKKSADVNKLLGL
ncbi:MAG: hypothetical protein IJW35_05615 [Lentisphaeria bacterium]|nr:hypothetical protein [Lentisphaeria bacterium]